MAKAWGGRFHQATDPRVEAFTESISFDKRLYAVDIRGSMAHATMLAHVGLITIPNATESVTTWIRLAKRLRRDSLPSGWIWKTFTCTSRTL